MRKIIPAVLESNAKRFEKSLKIAELLSKKIQVDVADGKFVKNKTVGIDILKKIKTKSKIEFHLMVKNPKKYIDAISKKADLIAIHCEIPNFQKFISKKVKAVAINPGTSVKKISPVAKKIKKIIVLTVHPGEQGRRFIQSALKKIKQIKGMNKNIIVQVDGGINDKTIKLAEKAGADEFVVGHYIIKSKTPELNYKKLR